MKVYFAIVGAMCAVALTVTVALMIGPTVWAMLLGIIFGGLASLPMMVVVVLLIRRQPAPPPTITQQPKSPRAVGYSQGYPRPLPPAPTPSVDYSGSGDYLAGDYYYLPTARGGLWQRLARHLTITPRLEWRGARVGPR